MAELILHSTIHRMRQVAMLSGQRRLLVLSGERAWCQQQIVMLIQLLAPNNIQIIGNNDTLPSELNREALQHITLCSSGSNQVWLGMEYQHIIIDAHAGFAVDGFGAISGTLRAGVLMILVTPPLEQWGHFVDPENRRIQVYPYCLEQISAHFLQRLATLITQSPYCTVITPDAINDRTINTAQYDTPQNSYQPQQTQDQTDAIAAIIKVAQGRRNRPLVLTADRGRGKSAALGIAAAQLIQQKQAAQQAIRIVVTAPTKQATTVLFYHLQQLLPDDTTVSDYIAFVAPDELLETQPPADLLLVDEAAAIPVPMVQIMLMRYNRIVYATTVHGYEGNGRGFALRFTKILNQQTPQWRHLTLDTPIRWRDNDPLEAFTFEALLLNAAPYTPPKNIDTTAFKCEWVTAQELLDNEAMLKQLFGLLVLAHYQTRPQDLRYLLDSPNLRILTLQSADQHIVAVLLAAQEGEIETTLQQPIYWGERRLQGHMLPQSISNHIGIAEAITLSALRVLRIAIHPDLQQRGLGSQLLSALKQQAQQQGIDYLGTVFGGTVELINFWHQNDYQPTRVGLSRDAASGTHAVMMLQPLSDAARTMMTTIEQRLLPTLQSLLPTTLSTLSPDIVWQLLRIHYTADHYTNNHSASLDILCLATVDSFVFGQRQYENCRLAVDQFALHCLQYLANLSNSVETDSDSPWSNNDNAILLIRRVMYNNEWAQLAKSCQLVGARQARQSFHAILRHYRSLIVLANGTPATNSDDKP